MSSGGGGRGSNPSTNKGKEKASSASSGRICTLADLNRQPSPDSELDSDPDAPQEYYTGGEKSGMLVQDPSKGKHDIDAIFEQARQMGAAQEPFENLQSASSSRVFTGTARMLSGETVPAAQPQQPENVVHNIFFWSDGFTVNDGPLRSFDDPENASFLESIKKSVCPKELDPLDRRSTVHVNLVRREGKCPEPVKPKIPFQGVARTLGSGSSVVESTDLSASTGARRNVTSRAVGISVDDALPSTSIQIRLADGTRLVARFNYHHTVGDIRDFINASRPEAIRNYKLQAVGFPPKQLGDDSQTIEQAGLANSVVMQKL